MDNLTEAKLEADIYKILPIHENVEKEVSKRNEQFVIEQINFDDRFVCEMEGRGYKYLECNFKAHNFNQVKLGIGKKCDIFSSWIKSYTFSYAGVLSHNIEEKRECVIYEVKLGKIDAGALNQILRYYEAIKKIKYYDFISLCLIGKEVGDIGYLLRMIEKNVHINIYTYNYIDGELALEWYDTSANFIDNSVGFCNKFLVKEMLASDIRNQEYEGDITLSEYLQQSYVFDSLFNHQIK